MKSEEIIKNLEKYRSRIIRTLAANNWRHFRYYFLIRENFLKNNIDDNFKKTFCNFYIMNGARGLNNHQKDEFFKILAQREDSLEKILDTLYKVPGYKNIHKLFFSFATKLLHTINDKLPIYDGNVSAVLMLPAPIQSAASLENKIRNRVYIYEGLKTNFRAFLNNPSITRYLKDVRKEIADISRKDNFEWKSNLVSDTKLLDSLLWSLYPIMEEEINKKEERLPKLTKEESKAFRQESENGVLMKYIKWGTRKDLQIGMLLQLLANRAMWGKLESGQATSKKDKEQAIRLHSKALVYYPNLVYNTKNFRKSVGLPIIKKIK